MTPSTRTRRPRSTHATTEKPTMHDDTTDDTTTDHDTRCDDTTPPTDTHVVCVSVPLGEGNDAHRLARVGDWTFTVPGAAGTEPEILDTTLAERLGYERPAKIRDLIARYIKAGHISPREVFPTVGKTGGRPGRGWMLREADALFVVTRSETPKAVALTKEMIRVYMLVRRGLVPLGAPGVSAAEVRVVARDVAAEVVAGVVAPVVARLDLLNDRLRVVEAAQVPRADTVFCGGTEGGLLRAGMRRVAHLRTAHLRPLASIADVHFKALNAAWRREWKRELGDVQRSVMDATGHEGMGKHWDLLPAGKLTAAWERVRHLQAVAERDQERAAQRAKLARCEAQQPLNFHPKKGDAN